MKPPSLSPSSRFRRISLPRESLDNDCANGKAENRRDFPVGMFLQVKQREWRAVLLVQGLKRSHNGVGIEPVIQSGVNRRKLPLD